MTARPGEPIATQDDVHQNRSEDRLLDVVVAGGGQAGLAMAWHLAQHGLRFVVLEAGAKLGESWRTRWDSLTLFTPAEYNGLPAMPFPARDGTYPTKDPVADYLESYAKSFELPVQLSARVIGLDRTDEGFEVRTADATYRARQVVVATGPFQVPFIPSAAERLDASVTQVHSSQYRNPQSLPDGRALVVGGGNSGFQIAEELAATREVDLSVGTSYPTLPQRLLGKDLFWWLTRLGLMRVSATSRLGRRVQSRGEFVIGSKRRRLEQAGVQFRQRLIDANGSSVRFADASTLDVGTVIWATGFRSDYSWIHLPGVVHDGRVNHQRGVTDVRGLYFLGLSWQHTRGSALLGFVKDDAAYLSDRIAQQHAAIAAEAGVGRQPGR